MTPYYPGGFPSGTASDGDSVDASSEDPGGSPSGHEYSAGYETEAATRIGDEEVDLSEEVQRMREHHEGRHQSDGDHSTREHYRDRKRIPQAICSSLPLTETEKGMVVNVVENIDLARFGQQKGIPRVTLGVVAVVVDERKREPMEDPEFVRWTDEYRSACDSLGVTMSDLGTIKESVREWLEENRITATPTAPPKRDTALPGPTSPDDLPAEYWDNQPAELWEELAETWNDAPEGFRDAIPDRYRELVDRIRRWEPWDMEDVGPEHDRPPFGTWSDQEIEGPWIAEGDIKDVEGPLDAENSDS